MSAQSGRVFLSEETEAIERKLKASNISPAERRSALMRQAELFKLMGNIEGAAESWMTIASSDRQNHAALLEGAFCLFAIGELDRAEEATERVLQESRDVVLLKRAKYLNAQITALQTGDFSLLMELSGNADYEKYRAAIYYALWKLSENDEYKNLIIAEYPLSPEGFIAKNSTSVHSAPSSMWLLFPGRSSLIFAGDNGRAPTGFQTGSFSREDNAKNMSEQLKTMGFSADVRRKSADSDVWVVIVQPGSDTNQTVKQLRDKGITFFALF